MEYVHNDAAYCTHQEYTRKELDRLPQNVHVLELGVGRGSSPLMHEFCRKNPSSVVVAFETDSNWFNTMKDQYGDLPNYVFTLIDDWCSLGSYLDDATYDLVFVDQSPWEARIASIDLLKSKTNLFILHDYDYYNKEDNEWVQMPPNNIYVNDHTSWLGQRYAPDFVLEDNYTVLPPTLVMRKR